MPSFKDKSGKTYDLNLTVSSAKRVRDRTGVDLLKALDPKAKVLEELAADPLRIYEVVLALLDADDDLGDALDEAALEAAGQALVDAVLDFFHPSKAAPLRTVMGKTRDVLRGRMAKAGTQAAKAAEEFDAEAAVEHYLTSGGSAGGSPGRSESTPAPGPSAS